MNKKDIIKELENKIVSNVYKMDLHNKLHHDNNAKTQATIVCELIYILATINNTTYTKQENYIFTKYNLWKF